ncbi:MAG: PTS sugar transporter subunit IIA [Planctomycetes bacterium]|nr:PTS sugar transporter subunit IIA [Planctomycetota bacterium]
MKLTSLLRKSNVFPGIRATRKEGAMREILGMLEEQGTLARTAGEQFDADLLLGELMAREAKGSSGVGHGVAYPHIRLAGFGDFLMAVATAPDGVEYDTPDRHPVRLILMAVVPPEKNSLLLGVMACISQLVENEELRNELIAATNRDALWETLERAELEVKESVSAGDIMKRQFIAVGPDVALAEVAVLMHQEHVDVLPVLDAEGDLLGEVSAQGLFAACVPPYFSDMPSLRFVRDFDAFEHFFREKAHLQVAEILSEAVHAISAQTPLAEIIARLSNPEVSKLYVTEGRKLVGVIDNFSVIDKILSI